ncbi:hypothetical protein [Cryptosporangium sp. NPDC051539]|uniref:hypothetical protein n=1 Tax=Cryptosporangium sp. NPDC051539 TaxID=3363962 RepID=UPI0037911E46
MESSEFFVLLASPEAAGSSWVAREVEYWLAHRPAEKLLIAVTAGEILWRDDRFDPDATTCLPAAALTGFTTEPRWVDLREVRRTEQYSLQAPAFLDATAELAAPLHHLGKDDLIGRDLAQFRRTRRLARTAITLLTVLALGATASALFAVAQQREARDQQRLASDQQQIAEQQRNAAVRLQRIATSRQLIAQADNLAATDPRAAARLALAGTDLHDDPQNRAGLVRAVAQSDVLAQLADGAAAVTALGYSPDGRTLAVGRSDGSIRLWTTAPGRPPVPAGASVRPYRDWVLTLAFSPDGRTLVSSAAEEGHISLWRITSGAAPTLIGSPLEVEPDGNVITVAFAPDSRTIATAGDGGTVARWNISRPDRPTQVGESLEVDGMGTAAFSSDLRLVATGNFDEPVRLWDLSDPEGPHQLGGELPVADEWVVALAFTPDRRTLAVASGDEGVQLWDLARPDRPASLGARLPGRASVSRVPCDKPCSTTVGITFSRDGRRLAATNGRESAAVWDLADRAHPKQSGRLLRAHTDDIYALAFAPDDQTLVTGSADGTALIWDLTNRFEPRRLAGPLPGDGLFDFATFAGDGHLLLSGSDIWDIADPKRPRKVSSLPGVDGDIAPAVAPDGWTLATAGRDRTITLWDLRHPAHPVPITKVRPRPPAGFAPDQELPPHLAFSPKGGLLAEGGFGQNFLLWDVRDPRRPTQLSETKYPQFAINAMVFSPNGRTLVMSGLDEKVVLWDVSTPASPTLRGRPLTKNTGGVNTLTLSGDGRVLVSAGHEVILWDLQSGSTPEPFGPALEREAEWLAISPDSHTLAVADPNVVTLWDLTDPARPTQLGGAADGNGGGSLTVTAIAADGHTMLSGAGGGAVILWDISGPRSVAADPVGRACAIAGRGLAPTEWAQATGNLPYHQTCR